MYSFMGRPVHCVRIHEHGFLQAHEGNCTLNRNIGVRSHMKAEQNELITRIGPGTPCGALLRSYWQPVALVDEFDPRARSAHGAAAGEGGARARAGPGAVPRRRTAAGACSIATARTAAPTCRSAATRATACAARSTAGSSTSTAAAWRRRPSRSAASCASACASAAIRCCEKSGVLFAWLGEEGIDAAALPGVRLLRRAGHPQLRLQGPVALPTGCRRSRSASTRRIRRSCTATCRTSRWRRSATTRRASSSAAPAPATSAASTGR